MCWNRDDGNAYKGVVSLTDERVVAWEPRPGEQPPMTPDEFHECDVALRRDPRIIEALARRGVTDMELVLFDTWAYGAELVPERYRGRRIGWTDVWHRNSPEREPVREHASPGCTRSSTSTRWSCSSSRTSTPGRRRRSWASTPRRSCPASSSAKDVGPLEITQPDGPSFTLDGNQLRWQKWSMRLGFNFREGLVIHTLGYEDAGRTARSRTGCRSPRWSCPTATRRPTITAAPRSTSASGGSG